MQNNDDGASGPRLLTAKASATYLGITAPTFKKWVAKGLLPPGLPGMRRWDRKALDLHFDKLSGIESRPEKANALEEWRRGYERRRVEREARKAHRS